MTRANAIYCPILMCCSLVSLQRREFSYGMRGAKLESSRFDRPFELKLEFPLHTRCYENCREKKEYLLYSYMFNNVYIYI